MPVTCNSLGSFVQPCCYIRIFRARAGRPIYAWPLLTSRPMAAPIAASAARSFAPTVQWDPAVQAYLESALGVDRLRRMSEALTRPPLATCMRVNTLTTTPEDVLTRLPEVLTPEDRALLEQNPAFVHPQLPEAIILPGSGPHTIDYSCCSKEVVAGRRAGEAVMRGAHLFVPGILAASPGILAGDLVAVSVGMEAPGSDTYGITRGWTLESDPEREAAALPQRERMFIGYGRALLTRSQMFRERQGVAVEMEQRVFRTPGCGGLMPGQMMLQNLPSLVAARVLAPAPGSRVLDMCAAPGGKTTMLAQLMGDVGEVVAFDRSHSKAGDVRRLAEEFGLTCVKAYKMDATLAVQRQAQADARSASSAREQQDVAGGDGTVREPGTTQQQRNGQQQQQQMAAIGVEQRQATGHPSSTDSGAVRGTVNLKIARREARVTAARAARGQPAQDSVPARTSKAGLTGAREATLEQPFPPESFDQVLLDAPCTALGLRPRLRHAQTMADLQGTATYQRKLLDTAVRLLKPGGTMVYSTCTINPGENEANVRFVLDTFPSMRLVPQPLRLGSPGLTGVVIPPEGCGPRQVLLTEDEAALVQRFDPEAELDTIGFFIAKFEKTCSEVL